MDKKIAIFDDLFDIAARLKSIDCGYYVMYDVPKQRYEIHHSGYLDTLQLVLPYDSLDSRAIEYVNATRVENALAMIDTIEEHNAAIDNSRENAINDEVQYKSKHLIEYLDGGGRDVPHYHSI